MLSRYLLIVLSLCITNILPLAHADSAIEIDIGVKETLARFNDEVSGGAQFLAHAKGALIFPSVLKVGFGLGAEYGEGALQVAGKTQSYYSTAAASIGFQIGAQSKSIVLVFMTADALKKFQASDGWKAGVDGSVALIEWGAAEDINSLDITDPIIGFVFSNKGLMYNLTLEGSKFTQLVK